MASIARNRMNFVATEKESYKAGQDFVTTADREAQQIYLRTLSETFPTYGVIAEEDNLRTDCLEKDEDIYFTIDPLDGTKAFMRRRRDDERNLLLSSRLGESPSFQLG